MSRADIQSNNNNKAASASAYQEAVTELSVHPVFKLLLEHTELVREPQSLCPRRGWVLVTGHGKLHVNPNRQGTAGEWKYVLAHSLLHLGFGHHQWQAFALAEPVRLREWNAACDCFVARLLERLGLGYPPEDMQSWTTFSARSEVELYEQFCEKGLPPNLHTLGTAGQRAGDILSETEKLEERGQWANWGALLGQGLATLATERYKHSQHWIKQESPAYKARTWFIQNYPLLSALASSFELVEDAAVCRRWQVDVAAVDVRSRKILINAALNLDEAEWKFVLAHELLHVGLRHAGRRGGRRPFLWNVACDFVINGWLMEMNVGKPPKLGVLYDRNLRGQSAEAIYERIMKNVRYYSNLISMRGTGLSDILEQGELEGASYGDPLSLDDYMRRCLQNGLTLHEETGRGYLPAGLVEEIHALSHVPPPWQVEFAHWLDQHFEPVELRRSYARPSRRQSTTPDIPRPSLSRPADWDETPNRTFGVVLDTSGSMSEDLLGLAFGTIASFCQAHDITALRLVYCDAQPYDQGYIRAERIWHSAMQVQGRGGTVLQPAVEFLQNASDFPADAPILVITEGYCDVLSFTREHAILLPQGHGLPFKPVGPVFFMMQQEG